jgi:hypothetical protein
MALPKLGGLRVAAVSQALQDLTGPQFDVQHALPQSITLAVISCDFILVGAWARTFYTAGCVPCLASFICISCEIQL